MYTKQELEENARIRKALGHNGHECRVRITLDGTVLRLGSPTITDRSKDHWELIGWRSDVLREIEG